MRRGARVVLLGAVLLLCPAHVGSPDAWFEGRAGPYHVLVHVEAPGVIPGIATVNVRVKETGIERVTAVANRFDATGGAPPPDLATPVAERPGWYRTRLWIMTSGSYSITITIDGARGSATTVVPLGAVALRRLRFDWRLGLILGSAGLLLIAGALTIVGAAVREGVLPPGVQPDARRRRLARRAMAGATLGIAVVLMGSAQWWRYEDGVFVRSIFKPMTSSAAVSAGPRAELVLSIDDSAWIKRHAETWLRAHRATRRSPLVEDHGKLMHLFLIDASGGRALAHLHPVTTDSVHFTVPLPPLPPGHYNVFGDIVHESGFAQTLVSSVDLPAPMASTGVADADDSWAVRGERAEMGEREWVVGGSGGSGVSGVSGVSGTDRERIGTDRNGLEDGSVMTWLRGTQPLIAGEEASLRFVVSAPRGVSAPLELYMGMPAHAVVIRDDARVFIHLHPLGTISLTAQDGFRRRAGDRAGTVHVLPPGDTISFPYAFPEPGNYHLWVQVKRSGRVLTGVFDARVK